MKEADALDAMLESTGKPIGPLHGVPFSVKDNIDIAGLDSTIGLAKLCNKPASALFFITISNRWMYGVIDWWMD